MRWSRVGALVAPPLAAVACVSLGDLSGGGGAPDAGSELAPTPPPASGADGGDAARDADPRCPDHPNALFCDDFDHGPLGGTWSRREVADGGALTLTGASFVTPPSALVATTEAEPGTIFGAANLQVDLGVPPRRVRMQFDLYLDAVGSRSAGVGDLVLHEGLESYDIYLFVHGGSPAAGLREDITFADGGGPAIEHALPGLLAVHTWTRVIIEADLGARTASVTLEVPPGTPASPALDHVAISPSITGTSFGAAGGIAYAGSPSTSGWRVLVDDVVVEPW
jgi:hypothetical protein